jgi:SAM-dependent methyltransferase
MPNAPLPVRIRHPALYVWLLGGLSGSGLNLAVTICLGLLTPLRPWTCFAIGTLVNEWYHHLYYRVVYFNQEIRLRTPLAMQAGLYLIVAAIAGAMLWGVMRISPWPPVVDVVICLVVLAVLNTVINRISTFSSSTLAMVEYKEMGETFYDDQTDPKKVNAIRAWFHRSRHRRLTAFVESQYKPGMTIADLGCGNCWWNVGGLPVTGVDVNRHMTAWAKQHGRLADFSITDDLSKTGLPDAAFDIVIMSETLEHLLNLGPVIEEVRRILKPDGQFLITVPYDFFLGPFFVLFNINCMWQGYVRGSVYHRYRCGHINHFTKKRLRDELAKHGFVVRRLYVVNGLTLYAAAESGTQTGVANEM